jgi:hypothetical protein
MCQIKKLLHIKDTLPESQKIFLKYSSNEELISRIYMEIKNLNTKRTNKNINKLANELNRWFSEEDVQMNTHRKELPASSPQKEMQIKTASRFHLTSVGVLLSMQRKRYLYIL